MAFTLSLLSHLIFAYFTVSQQNDDCLFTVDDDILLDLRSLSGLTLNYTINNDRWTYSICQNNLDWQSQVWPWAWPGVPRHVRNDKI